MQQQDRTASSVPSPHHAECRCGLAGTNITPDGLCATCGQPLNAESVAWLAREYGRLVEALRFYADPATWDTISPHGTVTTNTLAKQDDGERARRALTGGNQ